MATCYTTDLLFLRKKNLDQQNFSIYIIEARISHWAIHFFQLPVPYLNLRHCRL